MYSRGAAGIAEQLGIKQKEAIDISERFYGAFPKIKQCIDDSHRMASERGFVETVCGRKRRLPEMQLPEFDFRVKDASLLQTFDALDFSSNDSAPVIPEDRKMYYYNKMKKAYGFPQKAKIKDEAAAEGIEIIDNGGKIADASRQCLNSRIQGSSADISKLAMIRAYQDEELRRLGFRMNLMIHDELMGECPKETAFECSERLCEVMKQAFMDLTEGFPIKCDASLVRQWYGTEITEENQAEVDAEILEP